MAKTANFWLRESIPRSSLESCAAALSPGSSMGVEISTRFLPRTKQNDKFAKYKFFPPDGPHREGAAFDWKNFSR